ncbi:ribosome recycling factor domain-containing protein, putative [Eimeria mitis]|uniref:Ribosome recycling factor domain-containing protein, putative n=1 Tax=Eimeria mitis TaxID=44415 RepID=U6KIA4_9EIME|nr:ribosome recycling factor domain-containing protein, putative [Eimeria mitis]CDJ35972.1 ribosome recycling factor domain-containing protein, putative [Eimeria mitis]
MRRMLKKLNYVAEGDAPHKENTRDWQPQEHQQTRRGREEKDRGSFDSKNTEAEAEAALEAAQQQMNGHLGDLVSRLKDLDVSRPKISTFEDIQVQVAGGNKRLSDLAQVQIKGSSVVVLTLFSEQHLSKVISALRRTDENWRIVEDGPVTVRVQLPKMTEDLRNSFIAQAKAATEEVSFVFAAFQNVACFHMKSLPSGCIIFIRLFSVCYSFEQLLVVASAVSHS